MTELGPLERFIHRDKDGERLTVSAWDNSSRFPITIAIGHGGKMRIVGLNKDGAEKLAAFIRDNLRHD